MAKIFCGLLWIFSWQFFIFFMIIFIFFMTLFHKVSLNEVSWKNIFRKCSEKVSESRFFFKIYITAEKIWQQKRILWVSMDLFMTLFHIIYEIFYSLHEKYFIIFHKDHIFEKKIMKKYVKVWFRSLTGNFVRMYIYTNSESCKTYIDHPNLALEKKSNIPYI